MGLSNELSCEAGSFSFCLIPHRFFQSEVLRLYFLVLEPWVARSVSLPSCSSLFIFMQMLDHPLHQPLPHLVSQLLPCHKSSPPWLPISTPPTGLDECFFFNSLVVGLPCTSIFWQFWVFVFFQFVVVLLLVVQGGKAYLPMPPILAGISEKRDSLRGCFVHSPDTPCIQP